MKRPSWFFLPSGVHHQSAIKGFNEGQAHLLHSRSIWWESSWFWNHRRVPTGWSFWRWCSWLNHGHFFQGAQAWLLSLHSSGNSNAIDWYLLFWSKFICKQSYIEYLFLSILFYSCYRTQVRYSSSPWWNFLWKKSLY